MSLDPHMAALAARTAAAWRAEHAIEDAVSAGLDHTDVCIAKRQALCGIVPRHGWGIDMFIEQKCSRCERAARAKETK